MDHLLRYVITAIFGILLSFLYNPSYFLLVQVSVTTSFIIAPPCIREIRLLLEY